MNILIGILFLAVFSLIILEIYKVLNHSEPTKQTIPTVIDENETKTLQRVYPSLHTTTIDKPYEIFDN